MFKRASQLDKAIDHSMAEIARLGSLSKLSEPVRTVLLVHAAQGIIDNGGLQYFFESDFPEKPDYSLFVDAYRAIGAVDAAAALEAAVKLFPFENPHMHKRRRNTVLGQFQENGGHRKDSPFEPFTNQLCGNEEIWTLLAKFVRKNNAAFS